MSIPGPTVHQQLLDAYRNVQGYLETERESILSAKGQRDELREDRVAALDRLAEHYLPELTQDAIGETWIEVRDGMTELLHSKQDHSERVHLELDQLNKQREQLDQELLELNDKFDEAQTHQKQISAAVEQQLSGDQEFVDLSQRAAVAEAALERAEANLHEIDQEASRKLPAYNDSSLFFYLYERGYGTEQYKYRGFTRRMDRWLARYIDFPTARQSYDFLSQTPDHMRKIIAEDRQSLDTVMEDLEARRDRVARSNGLPESIRISNELGEKRETHLVEIDRILEQIHDKNQEQTDVDDVRGKYYREAIERFRKLLQSQEVEELRRRAEQTEEISDDQIVASLVGVDHQIDQLDDSAREQREKLDEIQDYLDGLGRVIQRFRAAKFDSSRSNFLSSLNIDEEVSRAHEEGDVDALWKRIRRAQRWGEIEERGNDNAMHNVLVNAMSQAAGDERAESVRRAGDRRAQQRATRS